MEPVNKLVQQFLKGQSINGHEAREQYLKAAEQIKADPEIREFWAENQDKLADDAFKRSVPKLREYLLVRDKIKKNEATFIPGYVPKLVVSDHLVEITYEPSPETVAKQKAEQVSRRVTTISMAKGVKKAYLKDFDTSDVKRLNALYEVAKFTNKYLDDSKFTPGYYIYGPLGVGKTFLLGAMANDLADHKVSTTMVHFPSFATEMKASISDNSYLEKIDAVKKSPILMIDDIGAGTLSTWIRDEVLGVILEYRMQQELPMFFSSNLSMKQLEKSWLQVNNHGDTEPLKAMRLMERIRFLSQEVAILTKDRRELSEDYDEKKEENSD